MIQNNWQIIRIIHILNCIVIKYVVSPKNLYKIECVFDCGCAALLKFCIAIKCLPVSEDSLITLPRVYELHSDDHLWIVSVRINDCKRHWPRWVDRRWRLVWNLIGKRNILWVRNAFNAKMIINTLYRWLSTERTPASEK